MLFNIWGAKKSKLAVNMTKDIEYVHRAIEMLKALEPWWHFAGRMG